MTRPERARWLPIVLSSAAVALFALILLLQDRSPSTAQDRDATKAYAAAVDQVAKRGGRIVVEEIRPRLAELVSKDITPEQFRTEAAQWRQELESVRADFAVTTPPPRLHEAARLFDVAMQQYELALDAFVQASSAPDIAAAVTAATPRADDADHTYDQADALVQKELERVGLPTRPSVP